ncbi:hypothetical protein C8Q76DRAFT_724895 [Earliella scabrosa]|nr:hypothetical protein C8Q76DRAFT_724895 [Earliella scabrosa]
MSQTAEEPQSSPNDHVSEARDDWRFATPEEVEKFLKEKFSEDEKTRVWSEVAEVVRTHYDELVSRWKEELDTLLVYAGLFSAVLTAFNVQSYQLLQPGPADPTVLALQQISAQLNSFTIGMPFVNSTHTIHTNATIQPQFDAPLSAVWINALWFSSLVFSLASASLTLIVKQWLQQAITGLSGSSRDSARLRQYRLNGLLRWRVGAIVVALPIILQVALVLFLVGMIVLLWTLHDIVATVTSCLVAILFAFLIVVTVMPSFSGDCCYRSPQAFATYQVIRLTHNFITHMLMRFFRALWRLDERMQGGYGNSMVLWVTLPLQQRLVDMPTWHGREQVTVTRHTGTLDRTMATMVYATTLSTNYLERLHIILSDLPRGQLSSIFKDIWTTCEKHWGGPRSPGRSYWFKNVARAERAVLYALQGMLAVPQSRRDEEWTNSTASILDRLVSTLVPVQYGSELIISTLAPLSLGNTTVAWTASRRLLTYWTLADAPWDEVVSYSITRSILSMADWRLRNWTHEDHIFENFLQWCKAVQSVLLCLLRCQHNDQISAAQLQTISDKAQDVLLQFEALLQTQDWTSLRQGKQESQDIRREDWPIICPHRLSSALVRLVMQPLTLVYESDTARCGVPVTFVSRLEDAWSTIEREFPPPVDVEIVRAMMLMTELDTVHSTIETLKDVAYRTQSRVTHPEL